MESQDDEQKLRWQAELAEQFETIRKDIEEGRFSPGLDPQRESQISESLNRFFVEGATGGISLSPDLRSILANVLMIAEFYYIEYEELKFAKMIQKKFSGLVSGIPRLKPLVEERIKGSANVYSPYKNQSENVAKALSFLDSWMTRWKDASLRSDSTQSVYVQLALAMAAVSHTERDDDSIALKATPGLLMEILRYLKIDASFTVGSVSPDSIRRQYFNLKRLLQTGKYVEYESVLLLAQLPSGKRKRERYGETYHSAPVLTKAEVEVLFGVLKMAD